MRVHLARKSQNVKTGPIPVSTTEATTCPSSCPFKGNGCYASSGPLAIHWRRVSNHETGMEWGAFCGEIEKLPEGQLWRHNQAGDLPGEGDRIDAEALLDLVEANMGKRGFTYTHKPMTADNAAAVRQANDLGFTVNVSANNLPDADRLASLGVGPVVTVLPETVDGAATRTLRTPEGRTVVVCPATYRDDVSCATCGLCQRQRSSIVGFPAHGSAKRKASAIASAT